MVKNLMLLERRDAGIPPTTSSPSTSRRRARATATPGAARRSIATLYSRLAQLGGVQSVG